MKTFILLECDKENFHRIKISLFTMYLKKILEDFQMI